MRNCENDINLTYTGNLVYNGAATKRNIFSIVDRFSFTQVL
jgi:hypothetical protein